VETTLNDETFNLSLRKFLKMVGVNSQREIEQAVAQAIAAGKIDGRRAVRAKMTLSLPDLDRNATFESHIDLDDDAR